MRFQHIAAMLTFPLLFASCSEQPELQPGTGEEEHTYSFTAVLDGVKSRVGYEEDSESHNLKMVWEEDDVIRLYPDPSMNDNTAYYEFQANTGAGTSHTVFVHQGYVYGWENWKGKAIYVFPNEDNLDVPGNDEEFFAKSQVQIANDNTEHLKYAEHKRDDDGNKLYTEYWSNIINGENLKHDTKLHFEHQTTLVYKFMLRGFIYDIPGGSLLKVSGASWLEGEITLQLGKPEDKEPFLEVGEYHQPGWKEDAVLTAYVIRQVPAGGEDAAIKKDEKLKIELLAYDPHDGEVYPLNKNDKEEHRHKAEDIVNGENRYLTNIPWAEEYLWEVTATADRVYKAGDYVVADLTRPKMVEYQETFNIGNDNEGAEKTVSLQRDESLPRVAVDLGLPVKWATFNLGANKVSDKGLYYILGYTTPYDDPPGGDNALPMHENWTAGDPQYDAAAANWGPDWRMPTFQEGIDLYQYTEVLDGKDTPFPQNKSLWETNWNKSNYNQLTGAVQRYINGVKVIRIQSKFGTKRSIYIPFAGRYRAAQNDKDNQSAYPLLVPFSNTLVPKYRSLYFSANRTHMQNLSQDNDGFTKISFSVRAVRNRPAGSAS